MHPTDRHRPWHTARRASRPFAPLALLVVLVACGGGADPDPYQAAVDQAAAKEADARSLGVDSPCASANQCGLMTFLEPLTCPKPSYHIYSTVSATAAAASAAAGEQVALAQRAIALAPPPPVPCPVVAVAAPPVPACVASRCQAAP